MERSLPRLLDALFDGTDAARCLVDADNRVARVNVAWQRGLGASKRDPRGEDVTDVFPASREATRSWCDRARAGEVVELARLVCRVDGREARFDGTIAAIDCDGRSGLLITLRENAAVGPHAAEERFRALVTTSSDVVYQMSADWSEMRILFGRDFVPDTHEAATSWLEASIAEEDRPRVMQAVREAIATKQIFALEHRVRRLDGSIAWTFSRAVPLLDAEGTVVEWVGMATDVTDRKRSEQEIERAAERYERQVRLFDGVASTTPDFVYLFDRDGRFLYANRRLLEVWGMQLPDVIGKTCRELGYEQWHHDMHMREIAQVIETKAAIKGEVPFRAPLTGIFGVYEYIFTPVFGPDGAVEIVAGTTRDVTERKQAEQALRASEERLRRIIAANPIGVVRGHTSGRLLDANDAFLRLVGRSRDDLVDGTLRWDAITPPEHEARDREAVDEALQRGVSSVYEKEYLLPDGQRVPVLVACASFGDDGELVAFVVDITERRRVEEALRDSDRRKGEFLAVLSHELRNPLAPIRTGLHLLERAAPGSPQAHRAIEAVRRQTDHLTRLVDDLLDVTRISRGKIDLQRARIDLRDVVRKTTDDLASVFARAGIELRVDCAPGTVAVDADVTRLTQVLGNLLQNAAKFTPRGGRVVVALETRGDEAVMRVRDNGAGMDPETIASMFEPFAQAQQTLARSQGGLGLGLALVKGLVEMHGGSVDAHSDGVGTGAEFVVTLPLVDAASAPTPEAVDGPAGRARRILIVEDNGDAAQTLADVLALEGHEVRVAADGKSGLALAKSFRPDVVLCDLGLPDTDGYEVARVLRSDDPLRTMRLIALSGYAQPEDRSRSQAAGFDGHLAKPPNFGLLMDALAAE